MNPGWVRQGGPAGGDWGDGYVVDAPYIEPPAPVLCPAWFSMAAVLHGQPPLDLHRPLVWVDLGCGSGLPACVVAAANPELEVWGADVSPAHIERARALAAAADLTNCAFVEAPFSELAADPGLGPPEADVVVVHGVFSWVSPENQRHIVEFVRRRLRPGGLAYVMYEAPTGWSSMVPLAEAMRLHAAAAGGRSDAAFPDAVAMLRRLEEAGAAVFPLPARETRQYESLPTADARYGAHEYLGAHFAPVMVDEVVAMLGAARCAHLGAIEASDHLGQFRVPPGLIEVVDAAADPVLGHLVRDLATMRALRRDLFRRGVLDLPAPMREPHVSSLVAVGLGKALEVGATVDVAAGEVALDHDFYAPLVAHLDAEPLTIAEIRRHHPHLGVGDALGAFALLVDGGYAAPARADAAQNGVGRAAAAATRRLNQALIAENLAGADHRCLVSPVTGASVDAEYVEMATIGQVWGGAPADVGAITLQVLDDLARQQRLVREEGRLVEDPGEARAIVADRVRRALTRMAGALGRLGVA